LRLSAPLVIGIEVSDLKGKIASALKKIKNQRRSRWVWSFDRNFETERADRESFVPILSELKENFAPATELFQKLTPDAATILSQLARQAQKIKS
jgi:hypothetical protein